MRIVIPARYASTRLPAKLLRDVGGRPLLQHVHERALGVGAKSVIIATDDERIMAAGRGFGAQMCLTATSHRSGSERIAEVVEKFGWADDEIIINWQGDEPLLAAGLVHAVADALVRDPDAAVATAIHRIDDAATFLDPNAVKVVRDARQRALYFSRAPIPWPRAMTMEALRAQGPVDAWLHIGLYVYRAGFVRRIAELPECPIESIEVLEQLRVLWHGFAIALAEARERPGKGVDTEEDLARVRAILKRESV